MSIFPNPILKDLIAFSAAPLLDGCQGGEVRYLMPYNIIIISVTIESGSPYLENFSFNFSIAL